LPFLIIHIILYNFQLFNIILFLILKYHPLFKYLLFIIFIIFKILYIILNYFLSLIENYPIFIN